MYALREGLCREAEGLSFAAGTLEEECALTCSVLEEDAALAQVRRAAALVLAKKCMFCERGFVGKRGL